MVGLGGVERTTCGGKIWYAALIVCFSVFIKSERSGMVLDGVGIKGATERYIGKERGALFEEGNRMTGQWG